jgi:hypothetical protein
LSPEYAASTVKRDRGVRDARSTRQVAAPDDSIMVFVPPSHPTVPVGLLIEMFTVPVGIPVPGCIPDTVAVSDAGQPGCSGGVRVRCIRGLPFDTGRVRVWLEAPKLESPGYESVAV